MTHMLVYFAFVLLNIKVYHILGGDYYFNSSALGSLVTLENNFI